MSRILLVDDNPNAQRIGERILTDEGYEVVTVSNGDSALIRLEDADPDVVVTDAVMPGRSGYDICRYVKMSPRHRHVRVVLTAGVTESLDDAEVQRAGGDATLRKPFEASVLLEALRPLADAAASEREANGSPAESGHRAPDAQWTAPVVAVIDPEQVKAAVTVALDAVMAPMIDEISARVLAALTARRDTGEKEPAPVTIVEPQEAKPAPLAKAATADARTARAASSAARRMVRTRAGSILGLGLSEGGQPDAGPEAPPPGE
jgi:CheY-like chemotaxis protein